MTPERLAELRLLYRNSTTSTVSELLAYVKELEAEVALQRDLLQRVTHLLDYVWCVSRYVGPDAELYVEIAAALAGKETT